MKETLALVALVVMLGFTLRRRYGSIWASVVKWAGPRWPQFVKAVFYLTLVSWFLLWLFIDEDRRQELEQFYHQNAPWIPR